MSVIRSLVSTSVLGAIATLLACSSAEGSSSSGSSGSSGASSTSSGGSSGNTSSSSTSSSSSSSGEPTCQDFLFGSGPFKGNDLFDACDKFPPTNCRSGSYIVFDPSNVAGSCYCRVDCDALNPRPKPGEACDDNVVCTALQNKGGDSKGDTCLPQNWQNLNLCKAAGQ